MSYFSVLKFIDNDFRSVEHTFENQELAECYACHLASKESSADIIFEVYESGDDVRTFDAIGGMQYELKDGVRLISPREWEMWVCYVSQSLRDRCHKELTTTGIVSRGKLLFCPELIESSKGANA